jgi:hypothetical protein
MEQQGAQYLVFQDFRKKLSKFFSKYFGHQIRLHEDENVSFVYTQPDRFTYFLDHPIPISSGELRINSRLVSDNRFAQS